MPVERRPFPWAVSSISESVTITGSGRWILMSGQVALGEDGHVLEGDMASQTRAAFERIRTALEKAGAELEDVVKLTVYVTDMGAFDAFSAVRSELFPGEVPASTAVQVAGLYGGALIEVEAIAYLDSAG